MLPLPDMKLSRSSTGLALLLVCTVGPLHGISGAHAEERSTTIAHSVDAVDRADRPNWALELAASPAAFGQGLAPGHPDADGMGTTIQIQYQPGFVQRFGTLSLGPVFGAYPISPRQGVTAYFMSLWSLGGAIRYQARYVRNQIVVPSIGYEIDRMQYSFLTGQAGYLTVGGPVAGLQFLLNWLDPRRGSDFYEAVGVSHSYLVGEIRDLTGTDGTITASRVSWYFGLRFEM